MGRKWPRSPACTVRVAYSSDHADQLNNDLWPAGAQPVSCWAGPRGAALALPKACARAPLEHMVRGHGGHRGMTGDEWRWPGYRPDVHWRLPRPTAHPPSNVMVTHSYRAAGTVEGGGSPANWRWHGRDSWRWGLGGSDVDLHNQYHVSNTPLYEKGNKEALARDLTEKEVMVVKRLLCGGTPVMVGRREVADELLLTVELLRDLHAVDKERWDELSTWATTVKK
jgi:hypothetical protein